MVRARWTRPDELAAERPDPDLKGGWKEKGERSEAEKFRKEEERRKRKEEMVRRSKVED